MSATSIVRLVAPALLLAAAACGPKSPATGTTPLANSGSGAAPPATAPATAPAKLDPALCGNHPDELGPWILTTEQMGQRYGAGVASASFPTTQAAPAEMCGVKAENEWLASLVCADGKTHPYGSPDDVEQSRAGNTGAGGRCGGIIDLYKVPCPEKTYDVYVDMNLCGPGESFM